MNKRSRDEVLLRRLFETPKPVKRPSVAGCILIHVAFFIMNLFIAQIVMVLWNLYFVSEGLPEINFITAYLILIVIGFIFRRLTGGGL